MRDASDENGPFEVRLAESAEEVAAAQRLRHRAFFGEAGGCPGCDAATPGRDVDRFDDFCDHLLVIDPNENELRVVGTCRLLRRSAADEGFCSQDEFDLSLLLVHPGEVPEVGRSCVDPAYRGGNVMKYLWQGLAAYVFRHRIALVFGCASIPGTRRESLAQILGYLHHYHLAESHMRPRAVKHRYLATDSVSAQAIDPATAWRGLPPLIRGYLRAGARIGDGAVIDPVFRTTDVCVALEITRMTARYHRHYQRSVERAVA